MSVTARTHRLGLYLKSKDRRLPRNIAKKSVIMTPSSSRRGRAPTPTRTIMATRNWNFVKLINKVLQKWRNYGNSRVLPSIRSRDESSSRTRTNTILELSSRVQELQNEANCMNDSKDFQDAESVRSGDSHVTSRPVSFPPHPIPEGDVEAFFRKPFYRNAEPQRKGPPKHLGHTWYIGKRFCRSTCIFISSLSSRIASMEFVNRGAAPFIYSGER